MTQTYATEPREALAHIARTTLPEVFGEPFLSAFKAVHTQGNEEELMSAALICSLFLSAIIEGFPTDKLNTFVKYTRDNCSSFTFDCRMYDTIFEKIQPESLKQTALLDKDGRTHYKECCKQDIFEAFDFYTNR